MSTSDVDQLLREIVRSPNNHCFACGPYNPIGMHLQFEHVGSGVRAEFVPGEWHEGWIGVIHGGLLATALDEAMAYTLYYAGWKAMTARMEVRFRLPVQRGDRLIIEASIDRETRRIVDVSGRVSRDGSVVAESTARFMKLGPLDENPLGILVTQPSVESNVGNV